MKLAETLALRNEQAKIRFNKALPDIFPAPVLTHALNRRWTPPTPRLATDSYWRAHPLRADRLARALAARSGAPTGWTWRLKSETEKLSARARLMLEQEEAAVAAVAAE